MGHKDPLWVGFGAWEVRVEGECTLGAWSFFLLAAGTVQYGSGLAVGSTVRLKSSPTCHKIGPFAPDDPWTSQNKSVGTCRGPSHIVAETMNNTQQRRSSLSNDATFLRSNFKAPRRASTTTVWKMPETTANEAPAWMKKLQSKEIVAPPAATPPEDASLPPWKRELMKKKAGEKIDSPKGGSKSTIPAWKKNLLEKKKNQGGDDPAEEGPAWMQKSLKKTSPDPSVDPADDDEDSGLPEWMKKRNKMAFKKNETVIEVAGSQSGLNWTSSSNLQHEEDVSESHSRITKGNTSLSDLAKDASEASHASEKVVEAVPMPPASTPARRNPYADSDDESHDEPKKESVGVQRRSNAFLGSDDDSDVPRPKRNSYLSSDDDDEVEEEKKKDPSPKPKKKKHFLDSSDDDSDSSAAGFVRSRPATTSPKPVVSPKPTVSSKPTVSPGKACTSPTRRTNKYDSDSDSDSSIEAPARSPVRNGLNRSTTSMNRSSTSMNRSSASMKVVSPSKMASPSKRSAIVDDSDDGDSSVDGEQELLQAKLQEMNIPFQKDSDDDDDDDTCDEAEKYLEATAEQIQAMAAAARRKAASEKKAAEEAAATASVSTKKKKKKKGEKSEKKSEKKKAKGEKKEKKKEKKSKSDDKTAKGEKKKKKKSKSDAL